MGANETYSLAVYNEPEHVWLGTLDPTLEPQQLPKVKHHDDSLSA